MGRENALRAAVRAVEEYIGLNPLVIRLLSEEDGTPREDGELDLFLPEGVEYEGFFGKVPVEVKWSKNANVHPYKVDRHYLLGLKEDKGGFFFLVQRIQDVPHIYYAAFTVEDIDKLLEQKSYQVKIDLKEAPEDRQVFVKDLFDFATMRRKEKVVIPCEHELNNMMEDYEELLGKLDRINNEEDREKLEEMLNYLIEILKESDHSVIGWHDIFFFYSFHAVELAHDYLDSKDLINVQFDLGLYCYETKRYNLAEAYYNRVLDILFEDQDSDPLSIEQLMTLTNLLYDMGILMNKLNRYKEAESYYNMLIGEKDSFISLDRDFFRPLLADTYRNLAILYRKTNRLKEAKEMAVEAYVIYKRLTRKDSKQWKKTLENTGNLLDDIEARLGR